jgi:hypothetical protein
MFFFSQGGGVIGEKVFGQWVGESCKMMYDGWRRFGGDERMRQRKWNVFAMFLP